MCGQWVAAAVVVIGIICSLSHAVEGDALSDAKKAKASYMKIVYGGKQREGERCNITDEDNLDIATEMRLLAGKTPEEFLEERRGLLGGGVPSRAKESIVEVAFQQLVTLYRKYEEIGKEMCSLKKELQCEEAECVDCRKKGDVGRYSYCGRAKRIADAKEPVVSSGLRRTFNSAVLAALLAGFSLSL